MKFRVLGLLVLASLAGGLAALACGEEREMPSCEDGKKFVNGQCMVGAEVRLNSVGFLPARAKFATFAGDSAAFSVKTKDGTEVLAGTGAGPIDNPDTGEMVYIADFSSVTEPGEYYVEAGVGRSVDFRIAEDALDGALDAVMLGLYGQRCGVQVSLDWNDEHYEHGPCHTEEASLSRLDLDGTRDDTGGWHDAGDYGKYTRNAAFSVAFLVRAFEEFPDFLTEHEFSIPERGDDTPDVLDEARVQLEWLFKVQLENGSFAHKVTATNFEGEIMPEADRQGRVFVSTSTAASANAVAALAQAARVYQPYDADFAARCLAAAVKGQEFLAANPAEIQADQTGIQTGGYGARGDTDERLWAAAELWETTGEEEYLAVVETLLPNVDHRMEYDWADVGNLGIDVYALSERPGRDPALVAEAQSAIVVQAGIMLDDSRRHGYGRALDAYYWGSNGVVARSTTTLIAAHRLQPRPEYLDTLVGQLDHLLGRNGISRSYVTGVGVDPPLNPHHRPSRADGVQAPWPGLLVGGPQGKPWGASESDMTPVGLTWGDLYEDYEHNEIAINWSTGIAYALAAAIGTRADVSNVCPGGVCPDLPTPGDGAAGAGGQGGSGN